MEVSACAISGVGRTAVGIGSDLGVWWWWVVVVVFLSLVVVALVCFLLL